MSVAAAVHVLLLAFVVNAVACYSEGCLCYLMLGMLLLRYTVVHAVDATSWYASPAAS